MCDVILIEDNGDDSVSRSNPFLLGPFNPIFDNRDKFDLGGYLQERQHRTMDSGLARWHVLQTFMALDNSGPICRGDNLDPPSALSNQQSWLFFRTRHDLERVKVTSQLENKIAF